MRRLAAVLPLALAAAACGGSGHEPAAPENAYLTGGRVNGTSVRFEFKSRPLDVRAHYERRSRLSECGSGRPIRLHGRAFVVVHFTPAASAEIRGEQVVPTYTGPRRLSGPGPVLDTAKSCDFEADLGWAIGVERRMPVEVSRDGSTVTVSFG